MDGAARAVQPGRDRMTNRHNVTRVATLAGAILLQSGCFGAHGRDGDESAHDAGALPDPDGGTAPVDPVAPPPPEPGPAPAPTCGALDRDVTVTIETLGRRPCEPGRYDDSVLYGIEHVPGGIELSIDTCPLADDDCRCGVTVTGFSGDAASELTTRDGGFVTAVLDDNGVLVEETDSSCPMDDYSCVPNLVFAAWTGLLETSTVDPGALDFRWGDLACSTASPSGCAVNTFDVAVLAWVSGFPGAIGTEVVVSEGGPVFLDHNATTFELVRSTIESCPDERRARTVSWAAWRSR